MSRILFNFLFGFGILEMSKLCMFRAYSWLKDHFKDQMKLLYTDTDSFYLHITCEDLYTELIDVPTFCYWMEFSDIPASHPSGIGNCTNLNAGVLGKFKNETNGNPIVEFVGLFPKMYSYYNCVAQSSCSDKSHRISKQSKLLRVFLVLPNE